MNYKKIFMQAYQSNDNNFENITFSLEYTIYPLENENENMYAKTGIGEKTTITTKIDLYDLMGVKGTIEEATNKIAKSWTDNNYSILIVDENGNIID